MKRLLTILLFSMLALGLSAQGDYASLWKLYEKAQEKDQPKTALSHIKKIEKKAEEEKHYGHLLAALFTEKDILAEISPDSVTPMEKRMEAKYKELEKIEPIAAILYHIAKEGSDKDIVDSLLYNTNPEIVKELTKENGTQKYVPLVKKGNDSKYFNHDLISLIAHAIVDYESLVRYYSKKGNRKAACIMAALMLEDISDNEQGLKAQIQKADSLIAVYGDLSECGAIAVRKLRLMDNSEHKNIQNRIAWIDEAVKRWPLWKEINILKNEKASLTQPHLSATIYRQQLTTNQEAKISFENIRNISSVIVKATPIVGLTTDDAKKLDLDNPKDLIKFKKCLRKDAAISVSKKFSEYKNYEYFEDSISLGRLPLGLYYIETICDNDNATEDFIGRRLLIVSDLSVISLQQSTNKIRYVVVNANTSKPVAGARLYVIMRDDTKQVYTTNKDGEYILNYDKGNEPRNVFATFKDDNAQQAEYRHHGFYEYTKENSTIEIYKIFTDRSLYRPGQTMHASVIAYNLINRETTKALSNKEITLTLKNAEYKDVRSVKVTTDEFGVAAADFILPEQTKNGRFTINANNKGAVNFRVEEYVRPTFEVTFNKPEIEYKDGDTISVTGTAKTYSGVAVSNAKVAYTVCRNKSWWWRRDYDNTDLLEDSVMTDAAGNFTIKMPMILPRDRKSKVAPLWTPMFYDIKATAVVTDLAGESHEAQISLPLSNRATSLTSDIKDKYLKNDKPFEIVFTRRNNAGTEIEGEVTITIDGKEQGKAACGKSYTLPMNLPSGSHLIKAICGNDTIEQKFVLFSLEDKVPATETNDWWYATGEEFPATIQFGTCEKDVYAVYSIFSGSKLIESGSLKMDSSLVTRKFEYKEEYGDGLCYTIAWVRNGDSHSHSHKIVRPLPDKTLKLNWATFRNKLEPGQKEEWQLSIPDSNGNPANANVTAVLYDKSLDALNKHGWLFYDYRTRYQGQYRWQVPSQSSFYFSYSKGIKFLETKGLEFSVCGKGYTWKKKTIIRVRGYSALKTSVLHENSPRLLAKAAGSTLDDLSDNASLGEVKEEKDNQTDVQIRTNLNETAFFMPQLRTDEGIATLSFTLPESATTWKFMAFAHDKEVKYGTLTDEIVAQKKLMIQPRLPRFLREGDVTDIPASISNITEKEIDATVKFTILDAKTEKELYTKSKEVIIKAGETEAVAFSYDSRNQEDQSIIVRYMVSGRSDEGTFSDGEQKDLPILSQKELMVNTQTFILAEAGEKQFDLTKIMPSTNEKHLTVEYTDSPEWLMIKSLPYISKANDDCAICLVTAYYANSLAAGIAHSNPDIQKAVTEWNSEEMIQLFDSLSLGNRKMDALERLTKLQNNDGSWSWWKGMEGSTCMTVQVLKTLLRLNLMMNDENVKKQNEDGSFTVFDHSPWVPVSPSAPGESSWHKRAVVNETGDLYVNKPMPGRQSAK